MTINPAVMKGFDIHLYCEYNFEDGIDLGSLSWRFDNEYRDKQIFYHSCSVNRTWLMDSYIGRVSDYEKIDSSKHSMILTQPTCHDIGTYICEIWSLQEPPLSDYGMVKLEGSILE